MRRSVAEWPSVLAVVTLASLLVAPSPSPAQTAPPLGQAGSFAVLAGTTVTNTGSTVITGDLGVSPGTAVTGFPPGTVTGGTIHSADQLALDAQSDLTSAYDALAAQTPTTVLTGQDLGGLRLGAGVYTYSTSAQLTGTLTLDAQNDPNAVFIFQVGSTLTTASDSSVLVVNGGSNLNVFWQVASPVTLGTGTSFTGNILALTSITLTTGATVSGRALARNGAVTLDTNTVANGVSTPVTIAYFRAREQGRGSAIEWSTATESANVGFNLYVREGTTLRRLNGELIPSHATDSLVRQDYSYYAPVQRRDYFLEEVSTLGEVRKYGPFEVGKKYGSRVDEDPIDWRAVRQESQSAASVRASHAKTDDPAAILGLAVRESGVYRLTYEMLRSAGLDLSGSRASDLTINHRGEAIPLLVERSGRFGPGSYIEFIGKAAGTIYTDINYYSLEVDGRRSPRIPVSEALPRPGLKPAASYTETRSFERQRAYANYAPGDDAWYDTSMLTYTAPTSWSFPFEADSIADAAARATLELVVWGVTDWPQGPDHHVLVSVNGVAVADRRFDGQVAERITVTLPPGTLAEGANTLQLTLPGDTGFRWDMVNLDTFSVTYQRSFRARDGRLTFAAEGQAFKVENLPSNRALVYRISDGAQVRLRAVVEPGPANTYAATFAGSPMRSTYLVLTDLAVLVPQPVPRRPPADLDRPAELLVISHPDFIDALQPLVEQRRAQGLTVSVVDVNDLYARYTFGVFDPDAIRQYIAYGVRELGTRSVLLVGGDTFDYRNYLGTNSISFIPSIYVATGPYVKFVPADPKFADVNDDNVPDVAIGRFPVRTSAELDLMVRKTLAYAAKDYRRTAVFASDLSDGHESFKATSAGLAAGLPAGWQSESIHLDDTVLATARERLIAAMNLGSALVTFTGHSGPVKWTFSGLFDTTDAAALTNAGRPFVVVQWGCWNTYYVDPVNNYLVQSFLFSGDRGAVAVLGASTLTDSVSERLLGGLLVPRMAIPGIPIGQAVLDAKRQLAKDRPGLVDVLLGWSLMGDPTLVVDP